MSFDAERAGEEPKCWQVAISQPEDGPDLTVITRNVNGQGSVSWRKDSNAPPLTIWEAGDIAIQYANHVQTTQPHPGLRDEVYLLGPDGETILVRPTVYKSPDQ